MNKRRVLLYRLGTVLVLLVIAAVMFVIGRGHTVYFDNKTFEYEGQSYPAAYRAVVKDGEKQLAKLGKGDRGMATWIGQDFRMTLEITGEKGGEMLSSPLELRLPYHLDGIVINLPAFLAGLPQDQYLSEFVPIPDAEAPEDEEVVIDEFAAPEL